MKDSSVGPVGLLDPRRQHRVLDGLDERCRSCSRLQQQLSRSHAEQRAEEEKIFSTRRAEETEQCRRQRFEMLTEWDQAEEDLISGYESDAIRVRNDLKRLSAVFRRKQAEGEAAIGRKVEARRQAILQQYETHKNQPGQVKRKEIHRINETLSPLIRMRDSARELTLRRMDQLPHVDPAEVAADGDLDEDQLSLVEREPKPESIDEALDSIRKLSTRCQTDLSEMQSGIASKIIDSHVYLPAGVAVFVIFWALLAFAFGPQPPWIPMAAGLPIAGVLGFFVYLILLLPLKKRTRRLYPRVERLAQAADKNAKAAGQIAGNAAQAASDELIQRRDSHLDAAIEWKAEQVAELKETLRNEEAEARDQLSRKLEQLDQTFIEQFDSAHQLMHGRADELAERITQHLGQTDLTLQQEREARAAHRHAQLQRLAMRVKQGTQRAIGRMISGHENVMWRFPDWSDVAKNRHPVLPGLDFLPLGLLRIEDRLRQTLRVDQTHEQEPTSVTENRISEEHDADSSMTNVISNGSPGGQTLTIDLSDLDIPSMVPVVMHRRRHSAVVITAPNRLMSDAIELAHQVLWRLLSGVAGSRAKLTLIDPVGRGQHFTGFMALADHDPSLVGHRVWTNEKNIEERLSELAHHVEDVLQSSLRDRFQRIEDYNELAGSMAEPYRAIAAVGLPEGLTRDGYKHLRALIESGPRCGNFTVMVCDESKPWPHDMPLPDSDRVLRLKLKNTGEWSLDHEGLRDLEFQPAKSPPTSMRDELIERIGTDTVNASRVEIPLDSILTTVDEAKGITNEGIDIVIGSQGANRTLSLDLGEGVRQHALIAGKTGSGKSTLLHSIITSGAHRYRPDQLHFYLLDFKKGVEFKPYADSGLPHARVIGIESEREFGRSVLQRLDEELQKRGERFRGHGVQSLDEFRAASGEPMPRIMLVVDEFQELFVRDDRLAGDCAMLLDRLVRQGRSFGMHVILSSQSLAGAYSLPRATLGQMAVRIAMQCSESDAAMILSDDNTAAKLISRPGEAIYNDAGGLVEGNQPFQVAWLASTRHREMLGAIAARDEKYVGELPAPVVFEGNRPCRWSPALADDAINAGGDQTAIRGLLGESVEIGPPQSLQLTRTTGRNVLLIVPPEAKNPILGSTLSGFVKTSSDCSIVYLDGNRTDDTPSLGPWLQDVGVNMNLVKPRDAESELVRLSQLTKDRGDESDDPPIVVVIDPLERFRDLRQNESFNFSLDAAATGENGSTALQNILRDGPSANLRNVVRTNPLTSRYS